MDEDKIERIDYDIRTTKEWEKFKESERWMIAEMKRLRDAGINPETDSNWQTLLNKFEQNVCVPLHNKQAELSEKFNLILPEIKQRYTITTDATQNAA